MSEHCCEKVILRGNCEASDKNALQKNPNQKAAVDADRNQSKTAHFAAAVPSEDTELHRERQRADQYMSAMADVSKDLANECLGKDFFFLFFFQLNLPSILECNVAHKTFNFPGTKCLQSMLHP